MGPADGHEVEVITRRLVVVGLPGASHDTLEISERDWPSVLSIAARQRITGLAYAAVRDGWLHLTPPQRAELEERHRAAMAMVLVLDQRLIEVSEAMEAAGVLPIVLKGPSFADAYYPDRSWRSYGDLDLLVSAAEWRIAGGVLSGLGFERIIPEPRPGFDERFGKGASFEDARKLQVDLHRTLALGAFGLWIDLDGLLRDTSGFILQGVSLRRLDDTNSLIHACIHGALGRQRPQLLPLRDILQIAWSGRIDWELLSARIVAWRLTAPVSHALVTAASTLQVSLPDEAGQVLSMPIGAIERRALGAYTTDRRERGGMSVAALWAIHGFRAKAAYVRAMVFPDRAFLRARASEGSGTIRRRLLIPIRWVLERRRADPGKSQARRARND